MGASDTQATIHVNLVTEVEGLEQAVRKIETATKGVKFEAFDKGEIESSFSSLYSSITKFKKQSDATLNTKGEANNYVKQVSNIEREYNNLIRLLKKTGAINEDTFKKMATGPQIKGLSQVTQQLQKEAAVEEKLAKAEKNRADIQKKINTNQNKRKEAVSKHADIDKDVRRGSGLIDRAKKGGADFKGSDTDVVSKKNLESAAQYYKKMSDQAVAGSKEQIAYQNQYNACVELQNKYQGQTLNNYSRLANAQKGYNNQAAQAAVEMRQAKVESDKFVQELKNGLSKIDFSGLDIDISGIKSLDDVKNIIGQLNGIQFNAFIDALNQGRQAMDNLGDEAKTIPNEMNALKDAEKTMSHFSSRLLQFFSIDNVIRGFKQAIRSAYRSVTELDKAMTEQAVVTDFSVGDLWGQLPEYTKQANSLGVATKEAYEAATLYYQQGLKTNEVNQLTTSTLKMARIAGLDAATATDRMTNALRGFNMELNETSAERVADVYSELAAVSATDVDELSVAMTKTASIAHSANMEFENTAAYLAQMLETTRESAETAGTALKTVIGRFTEVKSLYTKNQLTGTDAEGEAIDVNKVSTALRTAGIDMNKFFTGEVGLDQIFNELAQKWDSLSIVQQRYIATQAAGSRQQSRFIAMLGDYDRLTELQQDAYNSSGASAEQFGKTQESLESKINKLKNAWNEFTMGIANSTLIKKGVDVLTLLLNVINKITFSGHGLISTFAKLGLGITAIATATSLAQKAMVKFSRSATAAQMLGGFGINITPIDESKILTPLKGLDRLIAPIVGDGVLTGIKEGILASKGIQAWQVFGNQVKQAFASSFANLPGMIKKRQGQAKNSIIDSLGDGGYLNQIFSGKGWNPSEMIKGIQDGSLDIGKVLKEQNVDVTKIPGLSDIIGKVSPGREVEGLENLLGKNTKIDWSKGLSQGFKQVGSNAKIAAKGTGSFLKTLPKLIKAAPGGKLKIAVAVAALAVGVGKLVHNLASNQKKLKAAKKSADAAAKSAQTASERYKNFLEGKEKYDGLKKQLDGLAKGTSEYTNKLIEANAQVSEMVKNYKGLGKYTSLTEEGELQVSVAGWDEYEKELLRTKQNTQAASDIADSIVNSLNVKEYTWGSGNVGQLDILGTKTQRKTRSDINDIIADDEKGDWWREGNQRLSNAQIANLSKEILNGSFTDAETWLKENISNYNDLDSDTKGKLQAAISDVASNIIGSATAAVNESASAYLASASDLTKASGSAKTIATGLAVDQQEKVKDASLKYRWYHELFGIADGEGNKNNVKNWGMKRSDLMATYAERTDQTEEQVRESLGISKATDMSFNEWQTLLGELDVAEEAEGKVDEAYEDLREIVLDNTEAFKKLGDSTLKVTDSVNFLARLADSSSADLKYNEIDAAQEVLKDKDMVADLAEAYDLSTTEMTARLVSEIQKSLKAYRTGDTYANNLGVSGEGLKANGANAVQYQKIMENLTDVYSTIVSNSYAQTGDLKNSQKTASDVVNNVYNDLVSLSDKVVSSKKEDFWSVVQSTDWGSQDALESFNENLKAMGIYLPKSEVEEFTEKLIENGYALSTINLDDLTTKLKNVADIVNDLEEREYNDKEFTQDEYSEIISSNAKLADDFIAVGSKFYYVGGTITDLKEAVLANTQALYESSIKELEGKKSKGETYYNYFLDNKEKDTTYFKNGELQSYSDVYADKDGEAEGTGNDRKVSDYLAIFGSDSLSGTTWDSITTEEQTLVNEQMSSIFDLMLDFSSGAIDTEIQGYKEGSASLTQQSKYSNNPAGLIDDYKEQQDIISKYEADKENSGITQEEYQQAQILAEGDVKALMAMSSGYSSCADEITNLNNVLDSGDPKLIAAAMLELENARAVAEWADNGDKLFDTLDDLFEKLDKIQAVGGEGTEQIEEITEALKTYLGLEDLDSEYVAENMNLLKAALSGSYTAWQEYIKGATTASVQNEILDGTYSSLQKSLGITRDQLLEMNYDFNSLSFDKNGQTDITSWFTSLGFDIDKDSDKLESFIKLMNEMYGMNVELVDGKLIATDSLMTEESYYTALEEAGTEDLDDWMEDLDWIYNLLQDINEEQRKYNNLVSEADRLYRKGATGQEVLDNIQARYTSLETQRVQTEFKIQKRTEERDAIIADISPTLSPYISYDYENNHALVDTQALKELGNEEVANRVTKIAERLNEVGEDINEGNETLDEIEDTEYEIMQEAKQAAIDFEQEAYDAIVTNRETLIDEQESISDAIEDANDKLIDAMTDEIEKVRQQRENEETEQDLIDLQSKINYLSLDTSGANDLEILDLQKEYDDLRQDYSDDLVDQKIDELKDQNEEAAEQRQAQIDLLGAQLDIEKKTGALWQVVDGYLKTAFTSEGSLDSGSGLVKQMRQAAGYDGMSSKQKEEWNDQMCYAAAQWWAYDQGFASNNKANFNVSLSDVKTTLDAMAARLSVFIDEYQYSQNSWEGGTKAGKTNATVQIDKGTTTYSVDDYGNMTATGTYSGTGTEEVTEVISGTTKDGKSVNYGKTKSGYVVLNSNDNDGVGQLQLNYSKETMADSEHKMYNDLTGEGYTFNTITGQMDATGSNVTISHKEKRDDYVYATTINGIDYVSDDKVNWVKYTSEAGTAQYVKDMTLEEYYNKYGGEKPPATATLKSTTGGAYEYEGTHDIGVLVPSPIPGKLLDAHLGTATRVPITDATFNGFYTGYSYGGFGSDTLWAQMYGMPEHSDGSELQKSAQCYYVPAKYINVSKAKKETYEYETGGLADYTGPAWLDGTKSRPEYVLNAIQTQGFLDLVDVLDGFKNGTYSTNNQNLTSATNNNTINIDAEISNDYDVDQLTERIKKNLFDSGTYRNVTQINRLR